MSFVAPRTAKVKVLCRGKGCPFRVTSKRGGSHRLRTVERSFPAGVTVELRLTKAHRIGKDVQLRVMSGHASKNASCGLTATACGATAAWHPASASR